MKVKEIHVMCGGGGGGKWWCVRRWEEKTRIMFENWFHIAVIVRKEKSDSRGKFIDKTLPKGSVPATSKNRSKETRHEYDGRKSSLTFKADTSHPFKLKRHKSNLALLPIDSVSV